MIQGRILKIKANLYKAKNEDPLDICYQDCRLCLRNLYFKIQKAILWIRSQFIQRGFHDENCTSWTI
jgi:hypothetical protein